MDEQSILTLPANGVAVPPTERISDDEMAYYQRVLRDMRNAQAVFNSWGAHLAEKYRLGPQDFVLETGVITRAPPSGG